MKSKFILALSLCLGISTFIGCSPETKKGTVYETALHLRALKIDSLKLSQQIIETKKEFEEHGCRAIFENDTVKAAISEKDSIVVAQCLHFRRVLDSLEAQLNNNQKQRKIAEGQLKGIDPTDGPVLPEPGLPCPTEAECILPKPKSFLVGNNLKSIKITFFDENGKEFNGIERIEPIKNSEYAEYFLGVGFPENFTMKVQKISGEFDGKIEYELEMKLPEIP